MPYTLISMIGTGMFKNFGDSEGYAETDYSFKNGKHFKTRLFMQALLECKYKEITQIILLGTDTSSWDALVDKESDERDETIELWSNLVDQCEAKEKGKQPVGVTRENLDKLQKYLSERFEIEVLIKEHTHIVDNNTSKSLFDCYTSVTGLVRKENDILFDITHGFRSMPVLLYQSLQYSLSQLTNRSVSIVYGELDLSNRSKAYVRDLSEYWTYSELAIALNVFKNKLDGFKLAELIEPYWSAGSKAIKRLSEIVQTNFALQIVEVVRQLKNSLDQYPENVPTWMEQIKLPMEEICKLVDENSMAKTLYNYSIFLYAHKLNVQAVITLQVAVETAIVEKYGNTEQLGDYDWWQKTGQDYLYKMKGDNWNKVGKPLTNLGKFRNQIAHGGGKSKTGGFPQAANIPNIYESGKRGIENLFKVLKDID